MQGWKSSCMTRFSASLFLRFSIRFGAALALFAGGTAPAQGVADQFFPTGISGGGRLMSVSINPENAGEAFVVCDMSGLYRTRNEGLTWNLIPSDVFLPCRRRGSSLRVPAAASASMASAASWGSNKTRPAFSADGGDSWTLIAEPPLDPMDDLDNFDQYYSLFVDPSSASHVTQRLVVDNYNKLWFSDEGGGSGSWTLIDDHPGGISGSFRLAGVFWDGSTIYVGTNVGIYRSTDGGANWSPMTAPADAQIVDFCGAKEPLGSAVTLFAVCVDDTSGVDGWHDMRNIDDDHTYLGLYTLTLTGGSPTWTLSDGPNSEIFVRVDAPIGDSSRPWAATSRNLIVPGIFQSTDGGASWTNTFKTAGGGFDPNENISTGYQGDYGISSWEAGLPGLAIDVSDSDPNRVIVTSDALHLTDDGGTSWMQMYVHPETENPPGDPIPLPKAYRHSGLGVTTGHWMHWIDADTFLCASTDVGFQLTEDGGVSWTTDHTHVNGWGQLNPPNWNCVVQKPGAARLYAAVSEINDFYEPENLEDSKWSLRDFGDVYYSDDNGQNWTSVGSSGLPDGEFPGPVVELAVDPANPDHLYAASANVDGGGIFRTADNGNSWSKLADPSRTQGHPLSIRLLGPDELVVSYCGLISGQVSGVDVYTASSGVFYSNDGGSNWHDRTDSDMEYFTRDLAVNPNDNENWFAAVQSRKTNASPTDPTYDGQGGVYRTTDSGVSWERIWAHDQVVSVTYVEGATPILYVTTTSDGVNAGSGGLWYSTNPHAATPVFNRIDSFPFARARRVFADPYKTDGTIWVTTQGGGLWRGTVTPTMTPRIVRNGAHYDFEVDVTGSSPSAPTLYGLTDLSGSPSGWSVLTGLSPASSTPAAGVTRYNWASVDSHSLFTSVDQGFVRAARARPDGTDETSDAAGWIFEEIQSTHQESWGAPWLRETEHESAAASLGSTLELVTPFAAGFASGVEYYIEIQEGAATGHRFDLVESTSTAKSWVIDSSNSNNTAVTLPALNGERIRLRRHLTLGEVFPLGDYTGTNNPVASDRVMRFTGTSWVNYWRLQGGSVHRWVREGDATLANQMGRVVPPGEGYLVHARASAATRVARGVGLVRQHLFRQPVAAGTQFHSSGFPVHRITATNHLQAADGFVATTNPATADGFQIWNGDVTLGATGYSSYWYLNHPINGLYYAKQGDATLTNYNTLVFPLQRAFFTDVGTAKPDRVVLCPWAP